MADSQDFQFHRERKKEKTERVEEIQVWIKGIVGDKKSAWAFVYIDGKKDISVVSGGSDITDKDRLQLVPVIEFLEWITCGVKKRVVTFYTESNYLVNVLKEWIDKWKKSQFKLADGTDRPNGDLIRRVDLLRVNTTIYMKHNFSSNEFTEKVDLICRNELNRS
jgi:ribonuclease HI